MMRYTEPSNRPSAQPETPGTELEAPNLNAAPQLPDHPPMPQELNGLAPQDPTLPRPPFPVGNPPQGMSPELRDRPPFQGNPPEGMSPELRGLPNFPDLRPDQTGNAPTPLPTGAPPESREQNAPELIPNHPLDHNPDILAIEGRPDHPEHINPGEEPPAPPEDGVLPNVWVYEGEAYDLSDFVAKHPGGAFFIGRMKNRDITAIVNIFHPNPEKTKKLLKKYSLGRRARPEDVHPKYNAPAFLFKEQFDGWKHTPRYNFQNKNQLLNKIRDRLKDPEMQKKVTQMDFLFDTVTVLIAIAYIAIQALRLTTPEFMPLYGFVPLMVMIRISLSGAGHYFVHRPQVRLNRLFTSLFDFNYVPMAFVVTDGHSLMHHPFTQSEVDIKRNVFTAMLELPRYYRVPIHTLHKMGHVCVGMFIRAFELCSMAVRFGVKDLYGSWQGAFPHYFGLVAMRVILFGELVLFWLHGDLLAWLAQFVVTLWISTFMIVASHDFEEETAAERNEQEDWAVMQIKNSYDLTIVGNKYVDCFLSAGLSPHRVHHVLPYQKSGFANIISEDIVREEAAQFDVPWSAPKNFFSDRLPMMVGHYLLVPSRWAKENNAGLLKEHLHPQAFKTTLDYIYKGFQGIGSI